MSQLILCLPLPDADSALFAYALSQDGQALDRHGMAEAALLPFQGVHDVVALVPIQALSWHRVQLPKGSTAQPGRLRTVLEGLLEEQVLDDIDALHCAVQPGIDKTGGAAWVTVCQRDWLRQALAVLENAGCRVGRIVPEFAPSLRTPEAAQASPDTAAPPADARLYAIGEQPEAWWVRTGSDLSAGEMPPCVLRWPLADPRHASLQQDPLPFALSSLPETAVLADAAVAEDAEHWLHHPVSVQHPAQRWLQAASSPWNLAQFDLASSPADRMRKQAERYWHHFRHAPQWQPVRLGLLALLVVQLLGLNWAAWNERRQLAQNKQQLNSILTSTFPQVKLVLDPPLQMEREVGQLRQRSGTLVAQELEGLLTLIGSALPGTHLQAVQWDGTQLRLKGLAPTAEQQQALRQSLASGQMVLAQDGSDWLIRRKP